MILKLKENEAQQLIEKTYTERCVRIGLENSDDTELVKGYNQNIADARACKTLTELMTMIQNDGDFDEDFEGLFNLMIESLITGG